MGCGASSTATPPAHAPKANAETIEARKKEAAEQIEKIIGENVKSSLKDCVEYACTTAGAPGGFAKDGALDKDPNTKHYAITSFPNPPAELAALETALRAVPLNAFGGQCDDFIRLLAEGAEKAAAACKPTFNKAVDGLSFKDARGMLEKSDDACTKYLDETCRASLMEQCKPVVDEVLSASTVISVYDTLKTSYNSLGVGEPITWGLEAWVLERAISTLFSLICIRENAFRNDPTVSTATAQIDIFGNINIMKGMDAVEYLDALNRLKEGKPASNKHVPA